MVDMVKRLLNSIKNIIKKGIFIMTNFKFDLQNHAEEATTATTVNSTATETVTTAADTASTTVTSAVSAAATTAATTLASTATSTANVITAVVATISADSHTGIADKIAALAAEIGTTKSLFVKIRNTVEIGALSVLLNKAASAASSKLDK
jgi:hypothetical protein